jgi:hypothetical protein
MLDKMLILAGGTPFDTRPFGGLQYDEGEYYFDVPKVFNNARKLRNAGANYERVWRCGYPTWDGIGKILDWTDPQYIPLMREYLAIKHQPFQGANPPPGARVGFQLFDGYGDKWALADTAKAKQMMRALFAGLKDLPYLDWWIGNELDSKDWSDFIKNIVLPEFDLAGIKPTAYGASYCTVGNPLGPMERQKGDADDRWGELTALTIWRTVHQVCDSTSPRSIVANLNWLKPHAVQQIRTILSMDGIFKGESPDDFTLSNGKYQRRPSHAQIKDAITIWMGSADNLEFKNGGPAFGYEYLPKAQKDDVSAASVLAISEMYKQRFGKWPDNYTKYPDDWIDPVTPEPEPPTPPIPVPEKCTLWYHLKRLNFRAAWAHILGRHK